jgi:RNA polymerase-binding transcription factor
MAAKKKTTKKKAKKKVAKKKTAAKKKVAKKKVSPKKTSKKKVAKKKVAKKTSKKTAVKKKSAKKATTKKNKETMTKKVTELKTKTTKKAKVSAYKEKKGEDYMGEEQSAHFRELLNAWKSDLMAEVDRTVHHMQDEASNFPDPNDRATQEEEFSLELRTRDRERKLIRKIEEAIVALDAGDYGYCEVCGIEIGVRRLEARPTATLCIDCKTLDEIKERQLG